MKRLLAALFESYYDDCLVDLIISVDKSSNQQDVLEVAESFLWVYGNKKVIVHSERQGLRNHILECGDLVCSYDAIILFEDDIVPAKDFFNYTREALAFYGNDKRVAGISLYSPQINEMVQKPFMPLCNEYDTFFIQSAQSWGQAWNKRMWEGFRDWYSHNNSELIFDTDMPSKIYSWPESSWKKYFMKYLAEEDKFFVYPYLSLSTNCMDVGQHVVGVSSAYQVPLQIGRKEFNFATFNVGVKYDVFFESICLSDFLEEKLDVKSVCVDLYGSKQASNYSDYLLSKRKLHFDIVESYALSFKPQEYNVFENISGESIFLYDVKCVNVDLRFERALTDDLSYFSNIPWKYAILVGLKGLYIYVVGKIRSML